MDSIIIDFEGLDCSFKETNSKALTKLFGSLGKRYDFPNYKSNSEYTQRIKDFLAGKFPNITTEEIIEMYMEEQAHEWFNHILPDIKNGIKYVILDRFWCSNLYYQPEEYSWFVTDTRQRLNLPIPNIIIKMETDLDIMLESIHKKNSKNDIIESNDTWIREAYSRFKTCTFPSTIKHIPITKDRKYRTREDIFNHEITDIYGEVVHNGCRY